MDMQILCRNSRSDGSLSDAAGRRHEFEWT